MDQIKAQTQTVLRKAAGAFKAFYDHPYYIAFFLYVAWSWLCRTTLWDLETSAMASFADKLVQSSILLLLAVVFLNQRADPVEWLLAALLGILGFVLWRTAAEGWLFWICLFLICGKGVRLKPLAVITFVTVGSIIVIAAFASSVGLIENRVLARGVSTLRNPMGFTHPNTFGAALLVVSASLVSLVKGRRCILAAFGCMLFSAISLFVADSRTSALCLAVLAISLPVYSLAKRKKWGFRLSIVLAFLVVAMALISFGFMLFYDPSRPLDVLLDKALSGRLRLAHTYYLDHAPSFFGHDYVDGTIYLIGNKEYTFMVDNLFVHILLRYGFIACAVFFFGIFALCSKMYKERYFGPVLLGMGLFLAYGMSETLGCRVECNFFIISLWTVLYHRPISEFDDTASGGSSDAAPDPDAGELSFIELVMLPINMLRRRHG